MAARLSEALGQQIRGREPRRRRRLIATEAVARARADGYTLLWGSTNVIAILPHITKVTYDPHEGFRAGQSRSAQARRCCWSTPKSRPRPWRNSSPRRSRSPNTVAYGGGGGAGSASNLIMALLLKRAGLQDDQRQLSRHRAGADRRDRRPYPGHLRADLGSLAQRTNPNIRMLAVSSGKRSPRMPDVPSIAETYPGYDAVSWTGMFAPAGTPKAIIDKIAGEMDRALKDPKFLGLIQDNGIDPHGLWSRQIRRVRQVRICRTGARRSISPASSCGNRPSSAAAASDLMNCGHRPCSRSSMELGLRERAMTENIP